MFKHPFISLKIMQLFYLYFVNQREDTCMILGRLLYVDFATSYSTENFHDRFVHDIRIS